MLTPTDLKNIQSLVDETITRRVDKIVTTRLQTELAPIKRDIKAVDGIVTLRVDEAITNRVDDIITKRLQIELAPIKRDIKAVDEIVTRRLRIELTPIKRDIKCMQKSINIVLDFADRETMALKKRVNRVEDYLQLAPLV